MAFGLVLAWFWLGFDVLAGGLVWLCSFLICSWRGFSSAMVCGFVAGGIGFWQKWFKVGLVKMAKKWLENLVMEIILFNTRFLIVPKMRYLRVIKRSGLRLELVNLANF